MKILITLLLLSACVVSASTEEKIKKTFAASPGGSLVVEADFGSIEIIADANNSEVSVDAWRKITRWNSSDEESYLKENPVELIQDGNTVIVRARTKNHLSWSWFSGWRNRNEGSYVVHVPEQFNANLKTVGGPIAVSNASGSVKADSSGGSLHFFHIHGSVDGHTSGGGIKVVDCEGEIRITTSGGGINVNESGGSLHGDTSGGGITVKTFNGPISIETSGGGITVENVQGSVKGSTSGGPFTRSYPHPCPPTSTSKLPVAAYRSKWQPTPPSSSMPKLRVAGSALTYL